MTNELGVYDFNNYKDYLRFKVGKKSTRKGLKSQLAKALQCQPTYISQVLNDYAHLSLEQATLLNSFFGHTKEESHFFILLLQKERAGNKNLVNYFSEQIQEILDRRLNLTKRLGTENIITEEQRYTFYSSWHYLAIQIALTIPTLQTKEALCQHFNLPLKKVVSTLEFLVNSGLVKQNGERFIAQSTLIRIGNDSPHITRHHSHWRMKAIEALDREDLNDFHYSSVISLSRTDIRIIKNKMLENLKEYLSTIRQSQEEEVFVLNMDFFNLKA